MWARVWDVAALCLVTLIVYVLVRPRSKAGDLVQAWADATVAIFRSATDIARCEGV